MHCLQSVVCILHSAACRALTCSASPNCAVPLASGTTTPIHDLQRRTNKSSTHRHHCDKYLASPTLQVTPFFLSSSAVFSPPLPRRLVTDSRRCGLPETSLTHMHTSIHLFIPGTRPLVFPLCTLCAGSYHATHSRSMNQFCPSILPPPPRRLLHAVYPACSASCAICCTADPASNILTTVHQQQAFAPPPSSILPPSTYTGHASRRVNAEKLLLASRRSSFSPLLLFFSTSSSSWFFLLPARMIL